MRFFSLKFQPSECLKADKGSGKKRNLDVSKEEVILNMLK